MKQKIVTLLVVVLIAGLMSLVVIGSNNKEKQVAVEKIESLGNGEPVLYYGDACPHCKEVEEWLKVNKVEEKVKFSKKEVWSNRQNAAELAEVAKSCGLDVSSIGVPFLYAEKECLVGTPDIEKYFTEKAGLSGSNESSQSGALPEGTPSAISN